MSASNTAGILALFAAATLLAGVFHRPLGLPGWAGSVFPAAAIILFLLCMRADRRAKELSAAPPRATHGSHRKRPSTLLVILTVLVTLSGPLWLPFTGLSLSLLQLAIVSVVSCIVALAALFIGASRDQPKV